MTETEATKDVVIDAARKLPRAEESAAPRWAGYEALRPLRDALAALDSFRVDAPTGLPIERLLSPTAARGPTKRSHYCCHSAERTALFPHEKNQSMG